MKKNIGKKLKETKGITLIALVITIIVLLILAGVSLSMVLNQDGIFSRAEQATDKYGQAKARETLELVLDEFQMTKYEEGLSGQNYENRLDSKIAEVGSLLPKEDGNSNYQLVIVEGHIFEIDRSVPKIVDYKGPANGVIVTAKITQNGDWQNPEATVTGTITKYGGGSVVSSSATATNNVTIPSNFPTAGGSYTIPNITTDTVITITATDNAGNSAIKTITGVKTIDGGVIKHIKTPTGLKEVNTKDIYGADILGYNCTRTGVEWQIFYIDEEDDHRVYLIAKDYAVSPVNSSTVTPKLLAGENDSYPKAFKFGTSTSDQSVLGSFIGNLATTPAIYNKFINDYLKEYSSGLNASSSQPNLQATKLMLDQAYWAEYKGAKADLVFGGPTLPLFQASYNDICRTATKLGVQQSGTGYQVKIGMGNFNTSIDVSADISTQKGIYIMGNDSNSAKGMWIASPSSYDAESMMTGVCYGKVDNNSYYARNMGFRPIVSLRSNVKFTSNADGTVYTIAN